eukprot:939556_1
MNILFVIASIWLYFCSPSAAAPSNNPSQSPIVYTGELVSFGFRTLSTGTSTGLHTVTVWYNRNVYQCTITPSVGSTTYTCSASPSFLGYDTTSESGAIFLIENPTTDAMVAEYVFITTTAATYQISGFCAIDSAVSTPIIGLWTRNTFMDGQDILCEDGYTHFGGFVIDADPVNGVTSSAPSKQVLHFDLTRPDITIDNALWEDGTSVTIPPLLTASPSDNPTASPSENPSVSPSDHPSLLPTHNPTIAPSNTPSASPTNPSVSPTNNPSEPPSDHPSLSPTLNPSRSPSNYPSISPTYNPTAPSNNPSASPTNDPSTSPSAKPSISPSLNPSQAPSNNPSSS